MSLLLFRASSHSISYFLRGSWVEVNKLNLWRNAINLGLSILLDTPQLVAVHIFLHSKLTLALLDIFLARLKSKDNIFTERVASKLQNFKSFILVKRFLASSLTTPTVSSSEQRFNFTRIMSKARTDVKMGKGIIEMGGMHILSCFSASDGIRSITHRQIIQSDMRNARNYFVADSSAILCNTEKQIGN
jgi:hypothetical protein